MKVQMSLHIAQSNQDLPVQFIEAIGTVEYIDEQWRS